MPSSHHALGSQFVYSARAQNHRRRQKNLGSGRKVFFRPLQIEPMEQRALLSIESPVAPYFPPQFDWHNLEGYLTESSISSPMDIAINYLRSNASNLGLTEDDFSHKITTDQYTDADTGITHIYLGQEYNGLEVSNAYIVVNVNADGCIINVAGGFVPGLYNTESTFSLTAAPTPNISPWEGLQYLGTTLGLEDTSVSTIEPIDGVASPKVAFDFVNEVTLSNSNYSLDPIPVQLQYVPTAEGNVVLTWNYVLRTPDGEHWYDASVDTISGELLEINDWGDSASYNVYPIPVESPNDGSRSIVTNTADPAASPDGRAG